MGTHAYLSASGAPAWTRCLAKPQREEGITDETSAFAEEGTAAHELLELALKERKDVNTFAGKKSSAGIIFTDEMCMYVRGTVELTQVIAGDSGTIFPEMRLDISGITTEPNAFGTADVVIYALGYLHVLDLKYGVGVKVDAEQNEQLFMYAAAAKEWAVKNGMPVLNVSVTVHQPRLSHASTWNISEADFTAMSTKIKSVGITILDARANGTVLPATPGEKQCKFCKVKGNCPEYRDKTMSIISADFTNLDDEALTTKIEKSIQDTACISDLQLSTCMDNVDLVKAWCAAIEKETYKRLINNRFTDPRYKLVKGRPGDRRINDVTAAEELGLKYGLTNSLYDMKLKSPATLEKLYKKNNPVFWEKLQAFIIRPEGKLTVVPHSDERPAENLELDFEPLQDEEFADDLIGLSKGDK